MYATTESNHRSFDPATSPLRIAPNTRGLSRAEEREVAALVAGGDQAARNRLVLANLGLVISIARRFQGRGLALDDLIGEGNLGLIRAAEGFDPGYGVRFCTYADYWIREAIRNALINRTATIRLPAYLVSLLTRWERANQSLCQEKQRSPSFDEVAADLGLTESQQKLVQKAQHTFRVSHESSIRADQDDRFSDDPIDACARTDHSIRIQEDREDLALRMRCLDERELKILVSRFGLGGESPLTLRQIGENMGLSREWIGVLEQRAIVKLEAQPGHQQDFTGLTGAPFDRNRNGSGTI